jgi:predicted lipid-binding transport protein (Tim44 family)
MFQVKRSVFSLMLTLMLALVSVSLALTSMDAEAKRLGGGRPAGMQRQMPAQPSPAVAPRPSQQPQGAAPAAQPGKRSWMGPIAGIAAGLGIAALMSHFGMGEALGQFMTIALMGLVAVVVVGWLMRRFKGAPAGSGPQLAGAGAPYARHAEPASNPTPVSPNGAMFTPSGSTLSMLPPGMDAASFTRIAKMIFIRMQAANDEANIEDLRKFTTPELFASLRLDLQERGSSKQQTDVMQLDADVVDTAQEQGEWVVSVRFHGLIREEINQGAQPFDELWHLVKPLDDSREWAIAGITPIES